VELLRKAGADEYLQRRSAIGLKRGNGNPDFFRNVFYKGTNDVNRYRLFELVAEVYGSSAVRKAGQLILCAVRIFHCLFFRIHEG